MFSVKVLADIDRSLSINTGALNTVIFFIFFFKPKRLLAGLLTTNRQTESSQLTISDCNK